MVRLVSLGALICLWSSCLFACGTERWAVKTLADADSAVVDFHPVVSSIDQLVAYTAPKNVLKLKLRVTPVETGVWRISGLLIGYKLETDGDYHLVLAEPGNSKITMIAEIPDPQCMPEVYRPQVTAARKWIDSIFGKPGKYCLVPSTPMITLTGVGFFDVKHGQTGVAKNGVELHPVLSIQ